MIIKVKTAALIRSISATGATAFKFLVKSQQQRKGIVFLFRSTQPRALYSTETKIRQIQAAKTMEKIKITFVTGNPNKLRETTRILGKDFPHEVRIN